MGVDIKHISTEQRNQKTLHIDEASTPEMLKLINDQDKVVALAVEKAIPQISKVVDIVYEAFLQGGRLIYMGAGTSGRIGILDAVECPPTYGVDYSMVQCLMAGGSDAFVKAKEGAEDDFNQAAVDLQNINFSSKDVLVGIAASGRTPYVLGGIDFAKTLGAHTAGITTCLDTALEKVVECPIVAYTGPEVITGSTRMKSGTAQKMICNMISTSAMIKMGKVYQNLMIDMKPTNEKLIARCKNIICEVTGVSTDEATILLEKHKTVKKVIFAYLTGEEDNLIIDKYLNDNQGNIQKAVKSFQEDHNK